MTTHDTAPHTTADPWHTKYRAERTKARVLGATTVATSLLCVGLAAWGLNADNGTAASGPGQFAGPGTASQFAPPGQGSRGMLPGGPMGQTLADQLFNSDGSVNTTAVTRLTASLPAGALEQMLNLAVSNGDLTQDQADAITAATGDVDSQDT